MHQDGIPRQNPDVLELKFSRGIGQNLVAILHHNTVLRIRQNFLNDTRNFNLIFAGHNASMTFSCLEGRYPDFEQSQALFFTQRAG